MNNFAWRVPRRGDAVDADPRVASVAGNVKNGNRVNLPTCWQAIEYVASQNLDRRAFAFLHGLDVSALTDVRLDVAEVLGHGVPPVGPRVTTGQSRACAAPGTTRC